MSAARLKPSCPPPRRWPQHWAARAVDPLSACGGGAATADVDRVVSVYRELRKQHDAGSIALMGWSAGGGLALRSTLKLQQLGEAAARGARTRHAVDDVTGAGDTFRTLMPSTSSTARLSTPCASWWDQRRHCAHPPARPSTPTILRAFRDHHRHRHPPMHCSPTAPASSAS